MPAIKKILFPVDFSDRAVGAGRYVESFAGRFDAEILLLHVIDQATHGRMAPEVHPSRQQQLAQFLSDDLKQFVTRRVCVSGDPAHEIISMAASWAPDLLMLPTYGLGRYRASLVGSVTAKVLHDVTCPVWTSVHAEEAPALEEITCRRVLCAVDLGARSRRVLDLALYLTREYQGDMAITHVTRQMDSPPMLANARARIAELLSAAGATAMILLSGVDGDPVNAIACAAKEFHADVLVAGRHRGGDQELFAKRNIYDIVGKSPCPVISV